MCTTVRVFDDMTYTMKHRDRRSLGSSQKPSGVLIGHTEGITNVSAKGDGRYIISNGKDQALRLWDLRKMRTNAEYEDVVDSHYGIRGYDYRYPPSLSLALCLRISLPSPSYVLQIWTVSKTKAPGTSVGLQRHDVPRTRGAPDPHTLPLQPLRDDRRAVHLLRLG